MNYLDVLLMTGLISAVALSLFFRSNRFLRVLVILSLFGTTLLCVFSMWAFAPRMAASMYKSSNGKQWSSEFRDGAYTMSEVQSPYYPYILIGSFGLALLALAQPRASNLKLSAHESEA